MRIVFVSNYYNHHQAPLSEAFYIKTNGNYYFIQTMPMEDERKKMGWGANLPNFVVESYKDKQSYSQALHLIDAADVVIAGSAPEKMIRKRIRSGKLVFRYSERIYKNIKNWLTLPLRFVKYHFNNFPSKNIYLLCASAYAAGDYAKTRNFIGKTYKWGYFPAVKKYESIDALVEQKEKASILWVARFIELKHPDASILVAERLKKEGYEFNLNLIGNGILQEKIQNMIKEKGLENYVHILGVMFPERVRAYMEISQIFLFTSDFNEGWGAVLNESMNSGCAVVASHAIGSVPFLIKDGENGFIYKNGNIDDLYDKVKFLLDHPKKCTELGKNAYFTLTDEWNADVAAERFLHIAENLLNGEKKNFNTYFDGPCAKNEE